VWESILSEEMYNKFKAFVSKYKPGTTLVSKDIFAFFSCPGAPSNSYQVKITVDKDKDIFVESPYLDSEGDSSVGWFDTSGKYHADTKNFSDNGDYIGGVQEARVTPVGMGKILPKEDVALAKEFIDLSYVGDIDEYDNFEPDGPIKIEYYPNEHGSVEILMSKHKPGTVFLSNDIGGTRPDPKAPRNSFTNKIIIDEDKIIIEVIHCNKDTDCEVGMGWFDFNGKYYNIDE
jgi:hypothetical protein